MAKEKTLNISKTKLRKAGSTPEDVAKYAGKYLLKRWTFGEMKLAQGKATKVIPGRPDLTDVDIGIISIHKLLFCIKEAPFPITEEEIRNLPIEIGLELEAEVNKLLGITALEVKN